MILLEPSPGLDLDRASVRVECLPARAIRRGDEASVSRRRWISIERQVMHSARREAGEWVAGRSARARGSHPERFSFSRVEVLGALVRLTVFKTDGPHGNMGLVGSIPMHFRHFLLDRVPR